MGRQSRPAEDQPETSILQSRGTADFFVDYKKKISRPEILQNVEKAPLERRVGKGRGGGEGEEGGAGD